MIELTSPVGALTEDGRATVQRELARVLLSWEGAPNNEFFRAQSWSYLHEVPAGAQVTGEDDPPRFRVNVTVPAGALADRRKAGLVNDVTSVVLAAAGLSDSDALRVWVLIHEQPDATWSAGGSIVRYADLMALAKGQQ